MPCVSACLPAAVWREQDPRQPRDCGPQLASNRNFFSPMRDRLQPKRVTKEEGAPDVGVGEPDTDCHNSAAGRRGETGTSRTGFVAREKDTSSKITGIPPTPSKSCAAFLGSFRLLLTSCMTVAWTLAVRDTICVDCQGTC